METPPDVIVEEGSAFLHIILSTVPILFLIAVIVILIIVIRYFVRLRADIKAIRQLLEDKSNKHSPE